MAASADNAVLDAIAEHVSKGECVLFLGAGVHGPPRGKRWNYAKHERPLMGGDVSRHLASGCNFVKAFPGESTSNLPRVAMCYQLEHTRKKLISEIEGLVHTGKKPSRALMALAELDFPVVATTNYDKLFETALVLAGKQPRKHIYRRGTERAPAYREPSATEPFVFKMHGDLDDPASLVVTDEDYIHFVLRMRDLSPYNAVPETFRFRFSTWPTLFVGYSLIDFNLRLLFKTLRWQLDPSEFPATYSVDKRPDALIKQVWGGANGYVSFIAQDVWTFVPALYQKITGSALKR